MKWNEVKRRWNVLMHFYLSLCRCNDVQSNGMTYHHLVVVFNALAPGHHCSVWCFRSMRRRAWYMGFHDLHMQVGALAQSNTYFLWTLPVLAHITSCHQLSAKILLRIWRNRRFWICGSDLLRQKTSWEYSHAKTMGCRCAYLCRCWFVGSYCIHAVIRMLPMGLLYV